MSDKDYLADDFVWNDLEDEGLVKGSAEERFDENGLVTRNEAVIAKYEEKCPKCNGRGGKHYGYYNPKWYECYRCKGTGIVKYKTSPEARAKAKEAKAKRLQKQQDEKVALLVAFLDTELGKFLASVAPRNDFAKDLVASFSRYGSLTEKQEAAAIRMMEKHKAREAEKAKEPQAPGIDLTELPKGRYGVPGGDTRLKVLVNKPEKGKWDGYIFVSDAAEYGSRTNFGMQKPGDLYRGKIQEELKKIMADPFAASVEYGKLTGTCGVCGRVLEDEESVAAGIGPVCAKKF